MNNYQGCKCPVCQQPFTEQDDVVVCPECGAPHHRECWAKNGGCGLAQYHGPGFEYRREEEGPRPIRNGRPATGEEKSCPSCGAKNPSANLFCENCGTPLAGPAGARPGTGAGPGMNGMPSGPFTPGGVPDAFSLSGVSPEQTFDDIPARDWAAYLGRSAPFYLLAFSRMERTKLKLSFSFSGFLFAPVYLLYRRSWGWGILAALASLLISLPGTLLLVLWSNDPSAQPASYLMFAQAASVYLTLAFRILFTLFSIRMIRSSAARHIQRLRRENPSDADFQAALAAHAGPSWVGVALYVAVVTAVSVVLMQFAGPELATVLFGG